MDGFDRRKAEWIRLFSHPIIRRGSGGESDLRKGGETRTLSQHALCVRPGSIDDENSECTEIAGAVAEEIIGILGNINRTFARKECHAEILWIFEERVYGSVVIEFRSRDEYGIRETEVGEASGADRIFSFLRVLE